MLSNSSVSEQTKMRASRHANMKTHARYQRVTQDNIEKKYEAMNPSLLLDEGPGDPPSSSPPPKATLPPKQTAITSCSIPKPPPLPNPGNLQPSTDQYPPTSHPLIPQNPITININSNGQPMPYTGIGQQAHFGSNPNPPLHQAPHNLPYFSNKENPSYDDEFLSRLAKKIREQMQQE